MTTTDRAPATGQTTSTSSRAGGSPPSHMTDRIRALFHRPAAGRHEQHEPLAPPNSSPRMLRTTGIPLFSGLLISIVFVATFLAAFHDPQPHRLSVAVVGPGTVVTAVKQGSRAHEDTLQVHRYSSLAAARNAVEHRTVFGALIATGRQPQLLVAGANGQSVTQALTASFLPVASQQGTSLKVTDIKPLVQGDSRGLSLFYAVFGVVLGGFLFGLTSTQLAAAMSSWRRFGGVLLFAALTGVIVPALLKGFSASPAPFAAMAILFAMLALAVAGTTIALNRIFGQAGTLVSSIVLLCLGNATSTGILPAQFLPGWLEPLTGILPAGPPSEGYADPSYFANDGVTRGILLLAAWVLVAGAITVLMDQIQERRSVASPA